MRERDEAWAEVKSLRADLDAETARQRHISGRCPCGPNITSRTPSSACAFARTFVRQMAPKHGADPISSEYFYGGPTSPKPEEAGP